MELRDLIAGLFNDVSMYNPLSSNISHDQVIVGPCGEDVLFGCHVAQRMYGGGVLRR